jgi:hypothetical protein
MQKEKKITPKQMKKIWGSMSDEQKADISRVTDGYMTQENYDSKWNSK